MQKTAVTFPPELFQFFRELKENNNRDFFQKNKGRYEKFVVEPMLAFIIEMDQEFKKFAPNFVGNPSKVGGSMFRINRDVRFAKDKSPYKTHAACSFYHTAGKKVHAPGFYLHIGPDENMVGGGIWQPDNKALGLIRDRIAREPDEWRKITKDNKFKKGCGSVSGEQLKKPPAGYDPAHPFIEDLKRKDFLVGKNLTEEQVIDPCFKDEVVKFYKCMTPLLKFLCGALGLE